MFDKHRCINTIYDLAKQKNIKIGDIEEKAGVSKGYLSRINKEGSTSSLSVELLDAISRQLGVGIDYLVNYSEETLSQNEQLVYQFIDKLMRMTLAGKLEWQIETSAMLKAEDNSKVENPLVGTAKNYSDDADIWYDCHVYRSAIYEEGSVDIGGACYHAALSYDKTIYLNNVKYYFFERGFEHSKGGIIEVYLIHDGIQAICSSYYVSEELGKAVKDLYDAIASAPSKIALSNNVKSIMRSYIGLSD